MKSFNLSALALRHQTLVLFFILILSVAGAMAYQSLGRAEDPEFTIRTMVVQAFWPGATAREMELQVADRIEAKLQEIPHYDFAVSYSKPGETVIKVNLQGGAPNREVADVWYQVRKKIGDMRGTLPAGVQGPFFNDEFGDVYSVIYAFSADGFSWAELEDHARQVRQQLLRVPGAAKVDLFGVQEQRIFVEFSNVRLAQLGVTVDQIFGSLQRQNAVAPTGVFDTATTRIPLRMPATVDNVAAIRQVPVFAQGRTLTIGDVAEVRRGYADPASFVMRHNGQQVVGLGVVMAKGDNVVRLGERLETAMAGIRAGLPVGIEVRQVADQPAVVVDSIGDFVTALVEALAIVLAVCFLSLGWRTGVVVALSVPLVLAITFVVMQAIGIDLHRISLGALVIALGLLVDDAIIAVEMFMVKLEQGYDRIKAATFAYTSTAFPMLTGTLVTAAGFVPVGFAKSTAGEYVGSLFWVVGIALIVSWIVAVIFTPYLGYHLLPQPKSQPGAHHDPYRSRPYLLFRGLVTWCVNRRWTVIAATVAAFVGGMALFTQVQQQFFPSSARPELLVDLELSEAASFKATQQAVQRLEQALARDPAVKQYASFTGGGVPRFYLPLNPELRRANFAQFIVVTDGAGRERVKADLEALLAAEFPELRGRVTRLENGPPVGWPVQFRLLGPEPDTLRLLAGEVMQVMRADPDARDVNLEWDARTPSVRLVVDQARARALGLDPQTLSVALNTLVSGVTVTQLRENDDLIDVVARAVPAERLGLGGFESLSVHSAGGVAVPLAQVARVETAMEEPIIWRRNRETMMTVRAEVAPGVQAPDLALRIDRALADMRARLPDGYRIEVGGTVEESAKSQASIFALMPLMALIMATVLMVQLQSFSKLALVFLTAPLGMIGVAIFLLALGQPFGFVALLGTIALAGMIMRNSVILVDQIDQDVAQGHTRYEAIVEATVRRARPILLTAGAAIFAMVPLSRTVFYGPMATAIMGGLFVATALTLLFLPALYAAWFRVSRDERRPAPAAADGVTPGLAAAE